MENLVSHAMAQDNLFPYMHLTKHFTILDPQIPEMDELFYVAQKRLGRMSRL